MESIARKRKRAEAALHTSHHQPAKKAARASSSSHIGPNANGSTSQLAAGNNIASTAVPARDAVYLQIVTGSYERVLHGFAARIPHARLRRDEAAPTVDQVPFSDTFLFAAHASAIRCLAISPLTEGDSEKRYLATGSSDERINVYSLSTAPPPSNPSNPSLPVFMGTATAENPRNRSLGSLIHHNRAITKLHFPTRSKLFSGAEDATIAISRTRDWTVLSSIKAPIPAPQGRPSGDTAAPGEYPAGIHDFAIHPSQKLMLSVGKGEKCMRLWNLMTGKKAGVLNFDRGLLAQVREGKFARGEGRRVLWDAAGENYVVGFERGAALFGIDSQPKAVIQPSPPTKLHEMSFLRLPKSKVDVLAVSTEDGRVLFFSTSVIGKSKDDKLPLLPCVAQLGGRTVDVTGRFKDFEVVQLPNHGDAEVPWIVVTGSSDGAVRLWTVFEDDLFPETSTIESPRQVGRLIATQETGDRITCLGAFVLDGKVSEEQPDEIAMAGVEDVSAEDSSDSST